MVGDAERLRGLLLLVRAVRQAREVARRGQRRLVDGFSGTWGRGGFENTGVSAASEINPSSQTGERHDEQDEFNAAMKENRGKFQDVQGLSKFD